MLDIGGKMSDGTKLKRKPELKVVFDSNVLYTGTASDLVNQSVGLLISESSRHQDITLSWYLPEIVVLERTYQMIKRGLELLPSIQKLEQLLGHNLNITSEIIQERVKDAVEKQLTQYSITVVKLAVEEVDWDTLIHNSAFRKAPFDPGEKEKGFRDAVLAQTFLQIVKASPTTPRICRIALVTADNLLSSSVLEQTSTATNIRIVKSIDELKSLINTLVSTVSEDLVAKIKEKATSYFFVPNQEDTLYYTAEVRQAIEEKFKKELDEIPEGADRRENGTWFISTPGFLRKDGQRVTWISPIEVEAKAFKYERQSVALGTMVAPSVIRPAITPYQFPMSGKIFQPALRDIYTTSTSNITTMSLNSFAESIGLSAGPEKVIAEGRTYFEVTWSHLLSTNQKFRSPRIDDIRFVKTAWEAK
jgi:hypothetical protein